MYGKSIPRDKLENEVGGMLKELQPAKGLVDLATAMFRHAWDARRTQAADIAAVTKRKITELEDEIGKVLDRIMATDNQTVIERYEDRVSKLEQESALLKEKLASKPEPKGAFEEKLELSLQFLSNPWKLWDSGEVALRRIVVSLAFTDHIFYCRNEGARTPQYAFPFKALAGVGGGEYTNGAAGEN